MLPVRRNNQNWIPEIFNDFFDDGDWLFRRNTATAPAINVLENPNSYDIELAAPGMTKNDFKVSLDKDGNLVIDMEKKQDNKEEDKQHGHYLRREFSYSKFEQTMLLPEDADREHISATVENGVLKVNIAKTAPEKKEESNRVIEIK
jgi:HSP20 family protein